MSTPMGLLTRFSQKEPFDLSQKPPGLPSLRLSQSDGESVPGSSCQEEDEESLYRRSQYSPEVDPHEPAGEDQYIPELKERGQGSPADLRSGDKQKPRYQHSLDEQTYERESGAEGRDQVHRLQSEEMAYESDLEVGDQVYQHETGRRKSYDYYSDSELEDDDDEPEQSKQQTDGLCDEAERSQSRSNTGETVHHLHTSEFMGVTGSQEEKQDKE